MIDLIYLHRLTTHDDNDSKANRIALLKELRNHDVNAFINAYHDARHHFNLDDDQLIQAHRIAHSQD